MPEAYVITSQCSAGQQARYQRTSLVVQGITIGLPMQGTWVPLLVQEDPMCGRATKPVHPNYGAYTL